MQTPADLTVSRVQVQQESGTSNSPGEMIKMKVDVSHLTDRGRDLYVYNQINSVLDTAKHL